MAYCVSCVAGCRMLYLWWRMDKEGRQRVWRLYGWFCALMICGSCFGVVTWAAWMMHVVNTLSGDDMLQRKILFQGMAAIAVAQSWRAVFTVTYAIEFMC